jgi:hypothetical protein
VYWLLVTANFPSSLILVTLMRGALSSSETLALTRATRHNIAKDAILHSHRRENLKSYIGQKHYYQFISLQSCYDMTLYRLKYKQHHKEKEYYS